MLCETSFSVGYSNRIVDWINSFVAVLVMLFAVGFDFALLNQLHLESK